MRNGKITINKKGNAKIKPEEGKEPSIPKEFDFSEYTPDSGKNKLACQFEGNPVTKIIIEGKEVPKDAGIVQQKKEEKEQAAQREAEAIRRKKDEEQRSKAKKSGNWWDDSFKANESCLPADTQQLLQDSDNFSLKLNKAARYIDEKFYFFKNDFNPKKQIGDKFKIKPNFGKFNFEKNCQKHLSVAKATCAKTVPISLGIDWRIILGLGHESVYETSITLHHTYGIPYIPATSLKGVVRSWIIQEKYFAQLTENEKKDKNSGEKAEKKAMKDKEFCDLFGCDDNSYYGKARQGQVTFFDAYPCSEPTIDVDIMNPHYPDYYGGDKPPTDYQNPIPIPFLMVGNKDVNKKALRFQFILGIKNTEDSSLLDTAQKWLVKALTEHGIGAKTAVGYGYMNE